MIDVAQEKIFQKDILEQMQEQGWLVGQSSQYNRTLALYTEDTIAFLQQA